GRFESQARRQTNASVFSIMRAGIDRRTALLGLAACAMLPGTMLGANRELEGARRLAGLLGVSVSYDALAGNDRVGTIITLTRRILPLASMTATDLELKRLLRGRIAESFVQGRLRQIDGWWLSDVEADLIELLECLRA